MTDRGRYGAAGRFLLLLLLAAAAAGCSTLQDNGNLVDAQGNHAANFVSTHPSFAGTSGALCTPCHGDDLRGGISKVSCFSASRNGVTCHASGPAFHPADWISTHPATALSSGNTCLTCHGADLMGGSTGVSCFSTSRTRRGITVACHPNGAPEPADHTRLPANTTWYNAHRGAAAAVRPAFSGCNAVICHGPTVHGEAPAAGPSCFSASTSGFLCHSGGPPPDFHPGGWYTDHRLFALQNGTASCATSGCHGATLHADAPNATGPSCFSASWGALSCHASGPLSIPPGTHSKGWLNSDNTTGFHGLFVGSITCANCHPITGHPTCTTCHFDANGSRAYAPLGFTHGANVFTDHRSGALATAAGTVCENCHQTSRTYRGGIPSCAAGGSTHPGDQGCHYNGALLDPVLINPRF